MSARAAILCGVRIPRQQLAAVEDGWFCRTFGRETEAPPFDDDDPDADHRPD